MKTGLIKKVVLYVGLIAIGIVIGVAVRSLANINKISSTKTGYEIACVEWFNKSEGQQYVLNKTCKVLVYNVSKKENKITRETLSRMSAVIYNMNDERVGDTTLTLKE